MSGNKIGGLKSKEKNLARDPNFYRRIGAIGGKVGRTGGFAAGPAGRARASYWGRIGGLKSKRGPARG